MFFLSDGEKETTETEELFYTFAKNVTQRLTIFSLKTGKCPNVNVMP